MSRGVVRVGQNGGKTDTNHRLVVKAGMMDINDLKPNVLLNLQRTQTSPEMFAHRVSPRALTLGRTKRKA